MSSLAPRGSHDQGEEVPMGATEKTVDLTNMVWFFAKVRLF